MLPNIKEISLLIVLNAFSSIGYSLLAPLYPTLAKRKGIEENTIGLVFSSFAISVCCTILSANKILKLCEKKKLLFISLVIESSSSICFGLLNFVNNVTLFIIASFIIRIIQGIGSALTAILVYSIAASFCTEKNMKIVIGLMEFAYSFGMVMGPLFASFFYYLGGYTYPFIICGVLMFLCTLFLSILKIDDERDNENISIFRLLYEFEIFLNFLALVVDMIGTTFFLPILSEHLQSKYGFSVETSSLFFIINMFTYFISLPLINKTTKVLGFKFTIFFGLMMNTIAVLMISPIEVFQQSYYFTMMGLAVLGSAGVFITIPIYVNFTQYIRDKMKYDDCVANDMAASLFNLGINVGESIGPIFGVYIMTNQNFDSSCISTSVLNFSFAILNLGTSFLLDYICNRKNDDSLSEIREFRKGLLTDRNKYDEYEELRYNNKHFYDGDNSFSMRFRVNSHSYIKREKSMF